MTGVVAPLDANHNAFMKTRYTGMAPPLTYSTKRCGEDSNMNLISKIFNDEVVSHLTEDNFNKNQVAIRDVSYSHRRAPATFKNTLSFIYSLDCERE